MTETELNAKLDELKTADAQVRRQAKERRALRRVRRVQRIERRLRIITYGGYAPHRGYLGCVIDEQGNILDGNHIKYPKNSNCQRWIKRYTGNCVRAYAEMPKKGNHYRRIVDYWWIMY